MAGCSSNFGVARVVSVGKEAVLRKNVNQYSSFSSLSFRSVMLNEAAFPAICVNNCGGSHVSKQKKRTFLTMCLSQPQAESQPVVTTIELSEGGGDSVVGKEHKILNSESDSKSVGNDSNGVVFDSSGGNGSFGSGGAGDGSGGGGGGGGDDDEKEEGEFGPMLKLDEVLRETEARGVTLPFDMLEAAKTVGIPKLLLLRYLDLEGSFWPLGFAMRSCSMLRNRMLADPAFLFKIGSEIVIDSCCATVAEYQQRGKDFWNEFELYVADLLVGTVVNVALVGMLAPYARIGKPSISKGFLGSMQKAYAALPSSVFEAERPGCRFSVQQRLGTYFFKGIMYGVVGFGCGIIGQGIANMIMTAKRSIKKSEDDVPVPPLLKSAALWGVFLAVSSNTRYQIINGLERLVETSPVAKQVPPVALAFTVGVRFANNVYGGMQFVDWARWSGVQ
ncbi:protein RETICULATA-RELATED 4, chloroplastic [Trifolium repens]|nr:protein RETICULATA-RELATED 4, chloroplastic [Trifolium repens]